jgi:hypothetical protein
MVFWGNDYHVLFQPEVIFEIIPISKMSYVEKINALSRLIILLSVLGFFFTFSVKYLFGGIFSLICIYFFYKHKEGFTGFKEIPLEKFVKDVYYPTKETNPLGNVLLTDYLDDPERKSAAPSFNPEIVDDINTKIKNKTKEMNGFDNNELFSGLGNSVEFEDSMQRFYATSSTTIPNDQGAFGTYLYGDMPSCKEGDPIQCMKDNYRYINP